jgi:hypothetical protein
MVKWGPLEVATAVFLALFLLSFAEIAAFAAVGAFTSFEYVIAAQMGVSILLFFITIVMHILRDITRKV